MLSLTIMPKSKSTKKKNLGIEDESDDEYTNDNYVEPEEVEDDVEEESPTTTSSSILEDDDIDEDIVIEISSEEETTEIAEIDSKNDLDNIVLSKHSIQGKHSLKYDTIFKGKKEDVVEEDMGGTSGHFNDSFDLDKSSTQWLESMDSERYHREKKVKERVYEVLSTKTDISFSTNRRKPSKEDFNNYYGILVNHLKNDNYTNIEIFNELAVYFSDNLFNMFKLLNNRWKTLIISELQNHIGEHKTEEILNRNILYGTEIEFSYIDEDDEKKLITGVVTKCYYEKSEFMVDSFENIYTVKIETITKILNNRKFKYNLNKLGQIDFL